MEKKGSAWWHRYGIVIVAIVAALGVAAVLIEVESQVRPDPGYSKVDEGLYMGAQVSEPPAGTFAVLNLCDIEDVYRTPAYQWSPIRDSAPAPNLDWLREQVTFVTEHRRAQHTVFVHCAAGVSRSGLVVVAYLMQDRGWTRDKALAYVRRNRPGVRPNPAFMELLLEWERALQLRAAIIPAFSSAPPTLS